MKIHPASEWGTGRLGLFAGVSEEDYHNLDACSNSRLTKLKISAAHCRAAIDGKFKDTPATKFGRAAHSAIFEPMEFIQRYDTARACEGTTAKGAACSRNGSARYLGRWFCGQHAPKGMDADPVEVISGDQMLDLLGMGTAMWSMPEVKAILDKPGGHEVSGLFTHPETLLLCKMRIDFLSIEAGIAADYKTARDAKPSEFTRKMFDYGYHRQAAWYIDGLKALGVDINHFVIIAQEKEAPYAACAVRLVGGALEAGRHELDTLVRRYAECEDSGHWPAYSEGKVIDIDLPEWAYDKIYEGVEA